MTCLPYIYAARSRDTHGMQRRSGSPGGTILLTSVKPARIRPLGDLGGILVGHAVGVHPGGLDEAADQELAEELPGLGGFRGGQTYWATIQAARR
jgi:hypothetical protein